MHARWRMARWTCTAAIALSFTVGCATSREATVAHKDGEAGVVREQSSADADADAYAPEHADAATGWPPLTAF